ncbi:MAG: hypothetical protein ACI4SB_09985 [Acutalibacteraceae bacterium]
MFFIYGYKNELEDDTWSGELLCPNCGEVTQHSFKLLKKYPTLFFIKIPLGRVIKRYLVCNRCGCNRKVKKSEYISITQQQESLGINKN